jgi:hypothetical protein
LRIVPLYRRQKFSSSTTINLSALGKYLELDGFLQSGRATASKLSRSSTEAGSI